MQKSNVACASVRSARHATPKSCCAGGKPCARPRPPLGWTWTLSRRRNWSVWLRLESRSSLSVDLGHHLAQPCVERARGRVPIFEPGIASGNPLEAGVPPRSQESRALRLRPAAQRVVTVRRLPMPESTAVCGSAPSTQLATPKYCCAGGKRCALRRRPRVWISSRSPKHSWSVCTRVWFGSRRWTRTSSLRSSSMCWPATTPARANTSSRISSVVLALSELPRLTFRSPRIARSLCPCGIALRPPANKQAVARCLLGVQGRLFSRAHQGWHPREAGTSSAAGPDRDPDSARESPAVTRYESPGARPGNR
jgi:hypothetical protein